ncbi:unnamed protein product (macronuclear) [Paramecium tetraurelia]|uniref:Uncharacterized protein n=1 Tax=Paramecium tetraurelia TaxID=5888 RepID=A0BZ77_PARTE|nr:uncharacterized protein GSPATT00033697001 [Paramecium tetraurelia]CAK63844.1 unnamed protein product [Paramecium tetraurelia]
MLNLPAQVIRSQQQGGLQNYLHPYDQYFSSQSTEIESLKYC